MKDIKTTKKKERMLIKMKNKLGKANSIAILNVFLIVVLFLFT